MFIRANNCQSFRRGGERVQRLVSHTEPVPRGRQEEEVASESKQVIEDRLLEGKGGEGFGQWNMPDNVQNYRAQSNQKIGLYVTMIPQTP